MNRITKFSGLMLLSLIIFGFAAVCHPSYVAYADTYQPNKAIEYAQGNWDSDRTNDCANFVSQCLTAGGVQVSEAGAGNLYRTLQAYGNASKLSTEYTQWGLIVSFDENSGSVSVGDPVFTYCPACNRYLHVTLCGGKDSRGYLTVYAHSMKKNNERLYADDINSMSHIGQLEVYAVHMTSSDIETGIDEGAVPPEAVTVTDLKAPSNICLEQGMFFGLGGTVSCTSGSIDSITGKIVNESGEAVQSKTQYINSPTGNLEQLLDPYLIFNTLLPGSYRYVVEANAGGNVYTVVATEFTVVAPSPGDITLDVTSYPSGVLPYGKMYGIAGSVSSPQSLSRVYAEIYCVDTGEIICSIDISPYTKRFYLDGRVDEAMVVNQCPRGDFIFKVEAENVAERKSVFTSPFTIR